MFKLDCTSLSSFFNARILLLSRIHFHLASFFRGCAAFASGAAVTAPPADTTRQESTFVLSAVRRLLALSKSGVISGGGEIAIRVDCEFDIRTAADLQVVKTTCKSEFSLMRREMTSFASPRPDFTMWRVFPTMTETWKTAMMLAAMESGSAMACALILECLWNYVE